MSVEKISSTTSTRESSLIPSQSNSLLGAILMNSTAMVQEFLEQKHDPNTITSNGNSLLHVAVQCGIEAANIVTLLLQYGATNDVMNSNAETPLYIAVRNTSSKIVELLLRANANPNLLCTRKKQTPLHLEIMKIIAHAPEEHRSSNWLRNFYLLLHYGGDLNVETGYGNTGWTLMSTEKARIVTYFKEWEETITDAKSAPLPMSSSSYSQDLEQQIVDNIVQLLNSPPKSKNKKILSSLRRSIADRRYLMTMLDSSGCHTILHRLVENNKRQAIVIAFSKFFKINIKDKEQVSDVNIRNKENETLLLRAIRYKHEDIALFLLGLGAKPNITTLSGESPILVAVQNKLKEVVKTLIDKKADVNIPIHRDGLTPLFAAIETKDPDMVRWLLDAGADTNVTLHDKTPLQTALLLNNKDILELLSPEVKIISAKSSKRAQVAISSSTSYASFFISEVNKENIFTAVEEGDVTKVILYLSSDLDVNARNAEGLTALHIAVMMGHEGIVLVLLSHEKIKVDELKRNGETALHLAILYQHHSITQLLLKKGANPNQKRDFDAITPFYLEIQVALNAGYPKQVTAKNHFLTIRQLLQHNADPTITTNTIDNNTSHTAKQLMESFGMKVEYFWKSEESFSTVQRNTEEQSIESLEMIAETFLDGFEIVEPDSKRQCTISRGMT
jgi:ankyrin repeat protein